MAYDVLLDPVLVLPYLSGPHFDFPDEDVERILNFLEQELGQTADVYRKIPSRRIRPGSPHFQVTWLFTASTGKVWHLRFIISDAKASYGVLLVRYADEL